MKEISLTQGKVAFVDDEDFERLNKFKWYAIKHGNTFYAKRHKARLNTTRTTISMHREIITFASNKVTDHRDGNGLNNCKANLRSCTQQQNKFNQRMPRKDNKLGVKGVCWHKQHKKFYPTIAVNGKKMHLGFFDILEDADKAYRIAEKKYFGEFARL